MEATGSTNRDLLDAAAGGAPEGTVLMTDHQTAGRGRQGRSWVDQPGSSLLVSWLIRPDDRRWVPVVPLATGLAVVETLARAHGITVGLKWPNDVLWTGPDGSEAKLAGILAEAATTGSALAVVTGMGMNLDWGDGRGAVPEHAVDLATVLGRAGQPGPVDRLALLRLLLTRVDGVLARLEQGDIDGVLDDYRSHCLTLGRTVTLETPQGEVRGRAVAVNEAGHLVVDTGTGVSIVTAGDAHHRPR